MFKTFLFAAVMLLLAACAGKSSHLAPGSAAHAIHDQQLHQLMTRMDNLMHERFMTETQLDAERRKYAGQIADNASAISRTVGDIITQLPRLGLNAADQSVFLAQAAKLKQQAEQLGLLAGQNHIDAIDDHLRQINETCSTCHAVFRKSGN